MPAPKELLETMTSNVQELSDDELVKEIAFAEGFGPEAHPYALAWLNTLRAELTRRELRERNT